MPPRAKKQAKELEIHDHKRIDHYYWLREKNHPDVIVYLEAENTYCDAMMAHTQELQESLYQEMHQRMQEEDSSVAVKLADYYYYQRSEKNKPYFIYARKHLSLDAPEEILLDLNSYAQKQDYLQLGIFKVSPDHKKLAYSLDDKGFENYTVYIKNLETQSLYPEQLAANRYSLEWANDSETLFYNVQDNASRPYKILRHKLGTSQQDDNECFTEEDALYNVVLSKSKDQKYIIMDVSSIETSEQQLLDAAKPNSNFSCVQPREKGLRYKLEHNNGKLFLLTNKDNAIHNKIMQSPVNASNKETWQDFITHHEDIMRESFMLFEHYLVLVERADGIKQLSIIDLRSHEQHQLVFPDALYSFTLDANPVFNSDTLRLNYSSLKSPNCIYDYHMPSRTLELKKQTFVPNYNPNDYRMERIYATAEDGVHVPISLIYKKDLKKDGDNPCLLYGYGSYGANVEPSFSANRISLLERGFVFAMAHIRGSSTLGRRWYEDGKFLNKKNTFNDFIACAKTLIAQAYTKSEKLAIEGRSAGGLLMGSVLNEAPELFQAALAGVPFMDVITTMQDSSIPLTVEEFEEWGNPFDKTFYDYMLSYSPYDNIEAKNYPHILVTAGLNDPRVAYWEPAKWTAKLRDYKTDNNKLLLQTNMGAGHSGASDRYELLRETAFYYAFFIDALDAYN